MESNVITIDVEKQLISAYGSMALKINAKIEMGELVALYGESGAGKTTLLRMLAGLTPPDRGYIAVGEDVWFDSDNNINLTPQLRDIGFMFQDYALFPNMTVTENIGFGQKEKNTKAIKDLMEAFGLSEFANRKPTKLSGGQKQRVALARALARRPRILLLDEPLSAVDAATRSALQDEIKKAHQLLNATTLLVSHDLTEVFRLAQKVLKIENGNVAGYGKPDNLFIQSSIGGKVQMTGTVVNIHPHDTFYLITVVTGMNQVIRITAFENDVQNLKEGDQVIVFTKALNPILMKL